MSHLKRKSWGIMYSAQGTKKERLFQFSQSTSARRLRHNSQLCFDWFNLFITSVDKSCNWFLYFGGKFKYFNAVKLAWFYLPKKTLDLIKGENCSFVKL